MKLSVGKKIISSFSIITFFIIISVTYVIFQQDSFNEDILTAQKSQTEEITFKTLQYNVSQIWQFLTDASLTRNESVIQSEVNRSLENARSNIEALKNKASGGSESEEKLIQLEENIKKLHEIGIEMFNAYSVNQAKGDSVMQSFDATGNDVIEILDQLSKFKGNTGEVALNLMLEKSANSRKIILISGIFVSLISIIIAIISSRKIRIPLNNLDKAAQKIAAGDYNLSLKPSSTDEIGNLCVTFNTMARNIKFGIEEVEEKERIAENAARAANEAKLEVQKQEKYLAQSTQRMLVEMEKFASGDLTINLPVEKDDDIGKLFNGFNIAVKNINSLISNLRKAVEATSNASTEISSSTEQLSAGAQEQSAQTNEVAEAVEQMTETILYNTKSTNSAAEFSRKAGTVARNGDKVVKQTVDSMERIASEVSNAATIIQVLGDSSNQIGEIIQVIDGIADQTNLLALNAAIEAARAGEQGRGFSIVADEVRKLAEHTTKATKEIADMIHKIQQDTGYAAESIQKGTKEVETGKNLASGALTSLAEIIDSTDKTINVINQVAAASKEQSAAAEHISRSIENINSVTKESSLSTQKIAQTAEDLNKLTINLKRQINRFKIDEELNNFS